MTDTSKVMTDKHKEKNLLACIKQSLIELNYEFQEPSESVLTSKFKGEKFELSLTIFCGTTYLTIQCTLPFIIPKNKFQDIINHINERNIKMPLGNYELHPNLNKFVYKIGARIPPILKTNELDDILSLAVSFTELSADEVLKIIS